MICTLVNNKIKCMMSDKDNNKLDESMSIISLLIIVILSYFIITFVLQYAWNKSVSKIFNLPQITMGDAIWLLIVSIILFKF